MTWNIIAEGIIDLIVGGSFFRKLPFRTYTIKAFHWTFKTSGKLVNCAWWGEIFCYLELSLSYLKCHTILKPVFAEFQKWNGWIWKIRMAEFAVMLSIISANKNGYVFMKNLTNIFICITIKAISYENNFTPLQKSEVILLQEFIQFVSSHHSLCITINQLV